MERKRLGLLTRFCSAGSSRRELAARLAGSIAAVLPFVIGGKGAEGKRKKKRKPKKACRCGACQECRGGSCVAAADDILCNGDGRCLNGQCNPRPVCASALFGCDLASPETCCSTVCNPTGPFNAACQTSVTGQECKVNDDCATGSCVGYRCRE